MAITVNDSPADYTPAYNDVNYVIIQNTLATRQKPNYKYIFRLYIDGVIDPIEFKVIPEPTGGFGIKNFGAHIENYVQSYILKDESLLTGGFQYMDRGIVKYHIEYAEEYSTPTASDPIIEYGTTTLGDKYAWNSALPYNEWINFAFNDLDISVLGGWMTSQLTHDISINNVGYHGVISSVDTEPEYLEVKTYDSAGVLIDTYQIQNLLSTGTTGAKYLSVSTAPVNLNNVSFGLVLGAQPIIDSAVASYTCQMLDPALAPIGDVLTFTMKEQCNYPIMRLHFQNKWGAFDAFNFDLVSKETVNIEKKSYKYNPHRVNGSGVLQYDYSDRSNVNYHIKSTNQIELNADWITEEQSIWLEELFTSPEIYLEFIEDTPKQDVKLMSVAEIQSKSYQIRTTKVDKLFNVNLIITLSNDNYRQRR